VSEIGAELGTVPNLCLNSHKDSLPFLGLVLAISLLTLSYQSVKAATANPVDSLRYE